MNNITCDICKDLIPLVHDGVASKESEIAVKNHIQDCKECKEYLSLFGEPVSKDINTEQIFIKFQKKIQHLLIIIIVFGIIIGLSLTTTDNILYNSIIMPIIGIIGYVICKWKALYIVPFFMFICNLAFMIIRFIEGIDFAEAIGLLLYVLLYIVFVVIGTVIAGLLHYSLRKE